MRIRSWGRLLCLFTLCTANSHADSEDSKTIRLATAIIEPYQVLGKDDKLSGYSIPVVKCLMGKLGLEFEIDVFPWARAQKKVEVGERDGFFVASRNSDRDTYATISNPIFSGVRSWYLRPDLELDVYSSSFKNTGIVGTVFGTNMHRKLKLEYKNVITKTSEQELINLLKLGRLDALLLTDLMFKHTSSLMDINSDQFSKRPAEAKPLGVYFGHHYLEKHIGFLEKFNSNIPDCLEENAKQN